MNTQTTNIRRLYLLRHALALPAHGGKDSVRALSPQGLEDASALGKMMAEKKYMPQRILCSTATRTQQTGEKILAALPDTEILYLEKLYSGGTADYLQLIHNTPCEIQTLMIVGHNPSIYELVNLLIGGGNDFLLRRLSEGYKPASLSVLDCALADWGLLDEKMMMLSDFMEPLDYNAPARPTRWT